MGIGGVTSSNSMSFMQMTTISKPDAKSKQIQDDITDVEREIQKLSSNADLSYTEKADERKTLQKEKSSLNTELDQRQEELLRSQKRESMLAELRENQKPEKEEDEENDLQAKEVSSDTAAETDAADESQAQPQEAVITSTGDGTVILKEEAKPSETQGTVTEKEQTAETKEEDVVEEETKAAKSDTDTETRPSSKEMRAMVSANSSAQQANRLGTIITKTEDGIAILKGEIAQDERRGVNTERKQAELDKMQKQEGRALAFQFSVLGETMNSTAETNVTGAEKPAQDNTANSAYTTAIRAAQEEQQRFQVSIA